MAEITGVVASVVQFLDVGARLSSRLGRLCSGVHNVPRRFHHLRMDLDQQLTFAQEIRAQHLSTPQRLATSPTFDNFLLEYIALADELRKTLDELLTPETIGFFPQSWHGLSSVRKEEDILHLCDRLEQRKSTLSLQLNEANLKISSNVMVNAEETLSRTKTIEENSRRIVMSTEQILPQIQQTSLIVTGSSTKTDSIVKELQQLRDQSTILAQQIGSNTSTLDRVDEASPQILSNMVLILESLQQLCSRLNHGGSSTRAGDTDAETNAKDRDELSFGFERTLPRHTSNGPYLASTSPSIADQNSRPILRDEEPLASSIGLWRFQDASVAPAKEPSSRAEIDAQHYGRTSCKCRSSNNTSHWQLFPTLHFTRSVRVRHFRSCPRYTHFDREINLTMQLVPPTWLLSRTIRFGFQLKNFLSKGEFSISPMVVGTSRLVDPNDSPAFLAVKNIRKELREPRNHDSEYYIAKLEKALENLFEHQKASPLDMDRNGDTILYEVLRLYDSHIKRRRRPRLAYEYVHLIGFLLEKGANPNVLCNSRNELGYAARFEEYNSGGTVLDMFAGVLREPESTAMFEILVDEGSEFSKPLDSLSHDDFTKEVKEYTFFEEQIELCDLSILIPIILQRDEQKFRQVIKKAKFSDIDHTSSVNGLTTMHFAVLWPVALRLLIGRGVDLNVEDKHGRRPIHLAVELGLTSSIHCLLEADCALFTPPLTSSLLEKALMLRSPEKWRILDALVTALSNRHKRLIQIARSLLSSRILSELNITEGHIKESQALYIEERLFSHGYTVPEALKLDGKSVYSSVIEHRGTQLAEDVADALWKAGFEDVDEPNEHGLTPILQSWHSGNFPMIGWLCKKKISLSSQHRDASLNGLHLYAAYIGHFGGYIAPGKVNLTDEYCMAQIQKAVGIPHDECTCPCSPEGCSPVKFLWSPVFLSPSRQYLFRIWLKKARPEPILVQQYVLTLTRHLIFEFLGCRHSCCVLGARGQVLTVEDVEQLTVGPGDGIATRREVFRFDKLPQPYDIASHAEEAEKRERALGFCMFKYDAMPRPDTLPPEEQPFRYIKWIWERYHVEINKMLK